MTVASKLRNAFLLVIILLTAVWLASLPADAWRLSFWSLRNSLIYYTGILSIGFMSIAVILAARPIQIESLLGGLDKFYRLHKWLGIAAAFLAIAHWLLEKAPRWLVQFGWLAPRQRSPRPAAAATGFDFFRDLHGLAAHIGEWGFYLVLVLVALALWKRFPYRYFFMAHRLLAAVYLLLVFHSVVLMGPTYWSAPIGPLLGILMASGSVAAAISLFRRIGQSRKAVGRIEALTHHQQNAVLDVVIRLDTAWPGHGAGQFAFVDFGGDEGAHPFSITSAWRRDGRLSFHIKGLGDYTRRLPEQLFVGQMVTVEGPYGRFDFKGTRQRQIWIGGGMGISPFLAGLQAHADRRPQDHVDLIYTTKAPAEAYIARVRGLAAQAGIRFHLLVEQTDGRLTMERLEAMIPEWKEADIWFSGPAKFGEVLRDSMIAKGFDAEHFHQEMFNMR